MARQEREHDAVTCLHQPKQVLAQREDGHDKLRRIAKGRIQ